MEIYQSDLEEERDFLSEIFYSDCKNYHAWSYRLWFVERFQLLDAEELAFVEEELEDQVTNNSLWSYRYFLLNKTREFSKELVSEELVYAGKKLEKELSNEAAWVYLRGWLACSEAEEKRSKVGSNAKKMLITEFPELKEQMHKLLAASDLNKGNRFIYYVLIDFAKAEGDRETAVKYLSLLKVIDRLRENYYQWQLNNLNA